MFVVFYVNMEPERVTSWGVYISLLSPHALIFEFVPSNRKSVGGDVPRLKGMCKAKLKKWWLR